ncbi:hypothetical protein ACQ4PT_028699 [Festuca glaucescens]
MGSISEVKDDETCIPDLLLLISSANDHSAVTQGMTSIETRGRTKEVTPQYVDLRQEDHQEDGGSVTNDHKGVIMVSDDEEMPCYPIESVFPMHTLPNSSHRSGSIYRSIWNKFYRVSDRSETRLEAKMHSESTSDCFLRDGECMIHTPCCMLQFFSLKLAKIPVNSGSVELYGYIAVRDGLDRLLNYVVNFSRDDPIIVEQGSLINMNGPKRAIHMYDTVFIEYDMKIKTGEQEKDDLQLIDGLSGIDDTGVWNCRTITRRIHGDSGAVDITVLRLESAVEGTVEVSISEVKCSFSLCLGCIINGFNEEICLFDGTVGESSVLERSVVAVVMGSWMDLKFKVGSESSSSAEVCSFEASNHGLSTQQIKTNFALISVKVTWSTLE